MLHYTFKVCLIVFFAVLWRLVSSDQHYLVCNAAQGATAQGEEAQSLSQEPRGERGIPGNKGKRGSRGPRGPPTVADYPLSSEFIDEKITRAVANIKIQIAFEIGNEANDSTDSGCIEDFYYRGRCYSLPLRSQLYNVTYAAAVSACKKHGAFLAEIHDQAQQIALEEHLRGKMRPSAKVAEVWVGMKFVSVRSTLLYRSGKEVPSHRFEWYSTHFPYSPELHSNMALDVRKSVEHGEGLWNTRRDTKFLQGAICERDF